MKKFISFALIAAMAVTTLVGCGNKGAKADGGSSDAAITVMSREDGSGTRGAFIELFGIEEEENGEKVDKTTDEASITNSTSVMMSSVANDANAIGYISLGSLNDTVKAVKIDGAEASVDNVKNGSYKVVRPFNIVLGKKTSDAANDFVNYIMSADGQKIIEDNGYIPVDEGAAAYQASNAKGKVVVGGSSSVSPVMEKLVEAYSKANTNIQVAEIGIKRALGAKQNLVFFEILVENVILVIGGTLLGIILFVPLCQFFDKLLFENMILGAQTILADMNLGVIFGEVLPLSLLFSIISGGLPAYWVVKYPITDMLKGGVK